MSSIGRARINLIAIHLQEGQIWICSCKPLRRSEGSETRPCARLAVAKAGAAGTSGARKQAGIKVEGREAEARD
jgi:hypothetical protein